MRKNELSIMDTKLLLNKLIQKQDLTEKEAARVFSTVIEWGRYAELFAYDYLLFVDTR